MESGLIGKWVWVDHLEKDNLEFRDDLTFEAIKDGNKYNGDFSADNDSVLEMTGRVPTSGGMTMQNLTYRIMEVNSARLRLQTGNSIITYARN
ncbi:MAG: hypothetical protein V1913_08630 [Fibrobacterota bacterium]